MSYGHGGLDFPRLLKPAMTRWVIPGWGFINTMDCDALINGTIYYVPIFVAERTTYIRVGVKVTVLQAASTLDLRLFAWGDGVPAALIEDFGNVSLAAVALQEIVIARTLERGAYFLAYRTAAGAGAKLSGPNNALSAWCGFAGFSNTTQGQSASVNIRLTAGAWADPAPAPDQWQNQRTAIVFLREN